MKYNSEWDDKQEPPVGQENREKEHLKSQENNLFQVWTPCQKSDDQ